MSERTVGVIGGSGLYAMEGLEGVEEHQVTTTYGDPSDVIVSGHIGDTRMLFLPRHGRGHRFAPHQINFRANLLALKQLGAEQVISVSAVGSMKESIAPGDMVVVDQFIDRTRNRPSTYFEDIGVVAHVELAEPVDAALATALYQAATEVGATVHRDATYVCIEGPQFSTRAESNLYRSWGVDVIGMTNLPEARLAREAELPYATLALATDYDCWHQGHESVTVEAVLEVMRKNIATAKDILRAVAPRLPDPAKSPASSAMKHAVMTAPDRISAEARAKLKPLIGRYLD
ncbi:MAG: S-methyl-5'-thioadenosine phosphorylase [Sandaracinus sp.]|nr:S-methyl-5'-thioadenosine phosphorylase [Sandaracinus sp.]|tara:strand:+ start:188 stop:1054 length:867 start_codon:yes stop_codon:yes gene_type:complete